MLYDRSQLIRQPGRIQICGKLSFYDYFVETYFFTNVSLKETIELAIQKVYSSNSSKKPSLLKLLTTAPTGILNFDNKLFQQVWAFVDGLSFGSSLAPSLGNLFVHVGEMENKFLSNGLRQTSFYKRYVDNGKKYRHLGQKIKEHNNKLGAIFDHRVNCSSFL